MTDLSQYQTDHLILLVGSNPLPNWVAAQVLLKEGGTIYLVQERGLSIACKLGLRTFEK